MKVHVKVEDETAVRYAENAKARGLYEIGVALEILVRDRQWLRGCLDQLATCCNILTTGVREDDPMVELTSGYLMEGIEFEVMRAAWLLGEKDEARRIHGFVGDHSETNCPVCSGDEAFASVERAS